MKSVNMVVVEGIMVADAETKDVNGKFVTSGSVAHNAYVGKDDEGKAKYKTSFFDFEAWNLPEFARDMPKGKPVVVTGRLEQQAWEKDGQKRSKVVIVVETVKVLQGKPELD